MAKVVIIGASFAGLRAYAYLKKKGPKDLEITLIDKQGVATYIPSLHLVLGNPHYKHTIQLALEKNYPGFVQGEVHEITETVVKVNGQEYAYDYLILATGAPTNFFQNESFKKYTLPAKTSKDIALINRKLRDARHIAVVGGGLTGVEYAAILATRTKKHISLVTGTERLLPALPEKASRKTEAFFRRKKTQLHLGARAVSATEDSLELANGQFIKADVIIWCAGLSQRTDLLSEDLLQKPNIFLAGDVRKSIQTPTAHNAMICGEAIAKSIVGKLSGKNVPVELKNWKTLAVALGDSYGLLVLNGKTVIPSPFVGLMKWVIERRIMYEWKTKKLLFI